MPSLFNKFTRRDFIKLGAIGGLGVGALYYESPLSLFRQASANVGIYRASSYQTELTDIIKRGISEFKNIQVKDKTVVLKPNIVEYFESHKVNTNPMMIVAAAEAFRSLGAKEVIVAEGPGHRRDTEILLEQTGFEDVIRSLKLKYVDLNIDDAAPVKLPYNHTGLNELYFPKTLLGADLVVSMPKLKTHHWVGVTLSLKNMFGTLPGLIYGWPKNVLHWRKIHNSIVDINSSLRPHFAIIDGIEGMEGNGPLAGETVKSQLIVMGDNLTAVDATATRLMGLRPERIDYMQMMADAGAPLAEKKIKQIGETLSSCAQSFNVLPQFSDLKNTGLLS
jgi:uncharacterized protein (DUF362 family)